MIHLNYQVGLLYSDDHLILVCAIILSEIM